MNETAKSPATSQSPATATMRGIDATAPTAAGANTRDMALHRRRRHVNTVMLTISGFALAFARAIGEYGSVIFIAGNLPMVSEIAPLLIVIRLEEFDYAGAAAIGLAMLVISFAILFVLNRLHATLSRTGRA